MRKLKKLSLKKEEIVNLNNKEMGAIKGGGGPGYADIKSGKLCDIIIDTIIGVSLNYAPSMLKDNTIWVGCTTDPARSKAYQTPGCIKP